MQTSGNKDPSPVLQENLEIWDTVTKSIMMQWLAAAPGGWWPQGKPSLDPLGQQGLEAGLGEAGTTGPEHLWGGDSAVSLCG